MSVGFRLSLVLLASLAGACSPASSSAPATPPGPSTPQVDDLRAAVFEVVIPKFENPGIEYAEPLPVHLLPHHERTDAYFSIGTAFTLDGTTFISAAHVFSLEEETQFGERRLRGTDGAIYEIDRFVAHSGVRDAVIFTLRKGPVVGKPLVRGATPAVGAQVYTVGNALGEGLAVRGGNVASFTPEPIASAWNFIRYSAPASPGNSGGPLLDDHGRVVGIVVRKSSDENLNYAVPIEELDRLSTTKADFFGRMYEHESGSRLDLEWRSETELPADYATLAARGRALNDEAQLRNRKDFEAKFRDLLFPTAPELRGFLREQNTYYYPTEVVRAPSGRWFSSEASSASTHEVDGEQNLYLGKTGDYFYVVLEREEGVPLATFVTEPQRVVDALLRTLNLRRTYAGKPVRITSYGPAHHQDSFRDGLGRPWTSTTWRLFGDNSMILHCTPYPRGLACILQEGSTAKESLRPVYARINTLRWTLSYDGRVSDWIEFLALDPALRPTFLEGAVTLAGPKLSARVGAISVSASNPAYASDSLIYVDAQYASMSPPSLRVSGLAVVTTKTRGLSLRVDRKAAPLESGTQSWLDYWDDLVAARAPYDGKVVRDGETAELLAVEPAAPMALPPDSNVESRLVVSCWTGDNAAVSDAALGKACAAFRKSIQIAAD